MYDIELTNQYANQEFSLQIDEVENIINILLQTTPAGVTLMTLSINNNILGEAFICTPNKLLVEQDYIINQLGGNFIFQCENNIYPNYSYFGTKCNLKFLTVEEIAEIQANA